MFYSAKREYDKAIAEGERAVALDPSGAVAHEWLCHESGLRRPAGRSHSIVPKSNPTQPFGSTGTFVHFGHALRMTGRFEEAVSAYKKAIQLSPNNIFAHIGLAATYILMGREKEARAEAAEVLRINPKFSLDSFAKRLPYKDQSVTDNFVDALRKAGLK